MATPNKQTQSIVATIVVGAPTSGSGKTTVTCGLIAAFSAQGLDVRCFKCGPDFLDGMQHSAALRAGKRLYSRRTSRAHRNCTPCNDREADDSGGFPSSESDSSDSEESDDEHADGVTENENCVQKRTANLDGWMQGSPEAVRSTFQRHVQQSSSESTSGQPVVCIVEGVMGLHDSRDGMTDDGSTAQIAKILGAPVLLVVDASACARSVAATALGHATFDPDMRLGGIVANKISGSGKDGAHVTWIRQAVESTTALLDCATKERVKFVGGLPRDSECSIPERHLGLHMPEETEEKANESSKRFERLVALMEANLDLDILLKLGRTCRLQPFQQQPCSSPLPVPLPPATKKPRCRIGVADDAAFCFYYADNLHLLESAGVQLVPFSPLSSTRLPPMIDALYFGGGYPELYADQLERNVSMRTDIKSFCDSGAAVFAECGGLMYLAESIITGKENLEPFEMCGVFPGLVIRMTPKCTMYYASIEISEDNPIFRNQDVTSSSDRERVKTCRGQEFHFSEVVSEGEADYDAPIIITPERPGAKPIGGGYRYRNTFASYIHFFFGSNRTVESSSNSIVDSGKSLADDFVEAAIRKSPHRSARAVSFVSAATEIVFALREESALCAVTSICDYPASAQKSPRQIIARSSIDAASMTSEEVASAMKYMKSMKEEMISQEEGGPSGHWMVDSSALKELSPSIIFVQNTCDLCDTSKDDAMYAINKAGLTHTDCSIVSVAPTTLEGMLKSILDVGQALDVKASAEALISQLRSRLGNIESKLKEIEKIDITRPRVLSLEGLVPLCTGGGWLPDIKYAAGCVDAFGDVGGCAPRVLQWKDVQIADPDVLIISPCSASPNRTLNEMHLLASVREFWSLRCVKRGNVYILGHDLFSRPGPRLVDGCEMIAALLKGVDFDSSTMKRWKGEAFKYECDVSIGNCKNPSHCTTELAQRFKPCFGTNRDVLDDDSKVNDISLSLKKCSVTRCTIPGLALPQDRSAHTIVRVSNDSLILFGGEAANGSRLSDVWKLSSPFQGWTKTFADRSQVPELGSTPTWEYIRCGKIHGEDVPTPRSNHASVACGDYLLVFGGWGVSNVDPLSNCELLHLDTFCWTHCSTIGNTEPSPRGNPTLVFFGSMASAILFGGWNGKQRFNDVWRLDMVKWKWEQITFGDSTLCAPRTDHSAVVWKSNPQTGKDTMIVFGGSVEGKMGSSSSCDIWALDSDCDDWRWSQIQILGPSPPPRTSHGASIVGEGESAKMIIVGGTDATKGSGKKEIICDAWVFFFGESKTGYVGRWAQLDWSGSGVERCRHIAVSVGDGSIVSMWGGFDGESTVKDKSFIWLGQLDVREDQKHYKSLVKNTSSKDKRKEKDLQERWEAEIPVTLDDLPPQELAKAKKSSLPGALSRALHRLAVGKGRDTYIDPGSGYSVFTQHYLKRRDCCGNGCRHCPYGHKNVPKKADDNQKSLEW